MCSCRAPPGKPLQQQGPADHSKYKVKSLFLLSVHKIFDIKKEKNSNTSAVLHRSVDEVYKTKFSIYIYIYSIFVASESKLQVKHHKVSKIKKMSIKAPENLGFLKIQNELSNFSKFTPY